MRRRASIILIVILLSSTVVVANPLGAGMAISRIAVTTAHVINSVLKLAVQYRNVAFSKWYIRELPRALVVNLIAAGAYYFGSSALENFLRSNGIVLNPDGSYSKAVQGAPVFTGDLRALPFLLRQFPGGPGNTGPGTIASVSFYSNMADAQIARDSLYDSLRPSFSLNHILKTDGSSRQVSEDPDQYDVTAQLYAKGLWTRVWDEVSDGFVYTSYVFVSPGIENVGTVEPGEDVIVGPAYIDDVRQVIDDAFEDDKVVQILVDSVIDDIGVAIEYPTSDRGRVLPPPYISANPAQQLSIPSSISEPLAIPLDTTAYEYFKELFESSTPQEIIDDLVDNADVVTVVTGNPDHVINPPATDVPNVTVEFPTVPPISTPTIPQVGDLGGLFQQFWNDVRSTSLFSLPNQFFTGPSGSGSSVVVIDGGSTFGVHEFDFAEKFGETGINIIKSIVLIIFSYAAIRVIFLKG